METEIYIVAPDWDERGQLRQDVLVPNCLDGPQDFSPLEGRRRVASQWQPLRVVRERSAGDADFLPVGRLTFAVTPQTWQAIRDLVETTVEALPVHITRENSPESFSFPKLSADPPAMRLLLHCVKVVPFRHGQNGFWETRSNKFDMSMGKYGGAPPEATKMPWLDPEELAGLHLFQISRECVASAAFVERVRSLGLTGLQFKPIPYVAKPRPLIPKLKKELPVPPRPDFAAATKGWSPSVGRDWQALWAWIHACLKNRGWPARAAKLQPPLSLAELQAFETEVGCELPRAFREVLLEFSAGVSINLGAVDVAHASYSAWEDLQQEFPLLFGGKRVLWDFKRAVKEWRAGQKFIAKAEPDGSDADYAECLANKLPFVNVANGDFVALDLSSGKVVYISHELDEELHGIVLGENFTDFMTRWSWIGLAGPDFMPVEPFFDKKAGKLREGCDNLQQWHDWLRGTPHLPARADVTGDRS